MHTQRYSLPVASDIPAVLASPCLPCRNVVELHSVVHIPKACVSDSSVSSRGKKDKLGGSCWGILLELLQVMTNRLSDVS
jgi:hypothetical protein